MSKKNKAKTKKAKPAIGLADQVELNESWYKIDFDNFAAILLDKDSIHEVTHDFNNLDVCLDDNEELLKSVSGRNIVYCIWERKKKDFEMVYIGQAKASGSRSRIRNHLFKKSGKTNGKLQKVKESIAIGQQIGITYIEIKPAFFRAAIEEYLISKYSDSLPWNEVGKN